MSTMARGARLPLLMLSVFYAGGCGSRGDTPGDAAAGQASLPGVVVDSSAGLAPALPEPEMPFGAP